MRALLSGVQESAFELPYYGIEALLAHDWESQHVAVIVQANYWRLVERIAE